MLDKQPARPQGSSATNGYEPDPDKLAFMQAVEGQLIVAEFTTLREEILRKIDHGHRLASLTLLAAAALFAFCLKDLQGRAFIEVYLFLLYPLFAFFMAVEWSFNNMRIRQLAVYLHTYVEKRYRLIGHPNGVVCHGWEDYLANCRTVLTERYRIRGEWSAVVATFIGTQIVALLSAGALAYSERLLSSHPSLCFGLLLDAALIIVTFLIIHTFNRDPI